MEMHCSPLFTLPTHIGKTISLIPQETATMPVYLSPFENFVFNFFMAENSMQVLI